MKRKKALRKDFRMEIRKSLNRFLSILLIVALGVAFYAGIQSAAPDMRITEDSYFDSAGLMDIRVVGTLGLTEEDLEAIRRTEGVVYVEGSWQEDVLCGEGSSRKALRLESLPEKVNTLTAEEGRLPERSGEIFLDSGYARNNGYGVGDTLRIAYSGEEEDSILTRDTYTVCGYGNSPMYIAFERGSTTVGNGELSGFAYVMPEDFDSEVYVNAYVLVDGAAELTAYTDAYDDAVDAVLDRLEEIADGRCEIRYQEVTGEAESELADARRELEDGKQELADARRELAEAESEAESELAAAESELLEGESELESGRQELADARDELADGEQELAEAESELTANEAEAADGERQLEQGRQELLDGERTLKSSGDSYEEEAAAARRRLKEAQATLDEGRKELEEGWEEYRKSEKEFQQGKKDYEDGAAQLEAARAEYNAGLKELNQGRAEYEAGAGQLAQAQAQYDAAAAQLADGQSEYDAGAARLAAGQTEYDSAAAQLEAARAEYEAGAAQLADGEKELEESRKQIAAGREQYQSGQTQLDASRAEYESGAAALAEQQAAYEAAAALLEEPLAEYEAAAGQIAAQRAQYEAQQQSYQAELEAYTASEQAWQADMASWQNSVTQAETLRKSAQEAGKRAERLRSETAQAEAALAESRAALQSLEDQRNVQEGILADPEKSEEEKAAAQAEADRLAGEIGKAKEAVAGGEKKLGELCAQLGEALREQEDCAAQADALESQLSGQKEGLDQTGAELTARKQALDETAAALTQAEQALLAGEKELAQGKAELDAQTAVLEGAKAELDAGAARLEAAGAELAAAEQTLEALAAQLTEAEAQLTAADAELEANAARLEAAKKQLEDGEAQLAASKAELDAGYEELAASKAELDAGYEALAEAKDELDAGYEELAKAKTELDAGTKELAEAKKEIDAGQKALDDNQTKIEEGEAQLAAAKKQLEDSESELAEGQEEIDDGYRQLAEGQKKLSAARKELDLGWSQWSDSQSQLADGQRQLSDARQQLADAREELADARQQISDGEKEIEENEQKLADGWEEYEEGKQTAAEEIADAKQKIADAEEELADAEQKLLDGEEELLQLSYPEWYVYDRDVLPENTGYGENAERMSRIGEVFPAIFFLVAALISLTTMTRMVEEQRTQIGTMKALGYSTASIASKYLKYALTATLGGSILGFLIGEKILPWVIINAYGILYLHTPEILLPYNWGYGLLAAGAAMICTVGAALSASFRALRDVPASLMRPPAPKQGRRVLLEYIPFVWNRLSFSWKSTVRNLMRYKKRCLMTVLGIGGCMGLLLVGYGLRDSIMDIAVLQFEELQHYEALVVLDDGETEDARRQIVSQLEEDGRVQDTALVSMQNENVRAAAETKSEKQWQAWVVAPESSEDMDSFFTLRDRESGEIYRLDDTGVIVTEKLADELGLEPGDTIIVENGEDGRAEFPIAHICENYLYHYVYISPALYEAVFGEAPVCNSILLTAAGGHEDELMQIGSGVLEHDGALSITYTYTMEEQVDSMLGALDIVIVVLIVSAGMLAFVVLYNLNNININERKRELATIKVLGFYDGEVAAYVYRENVLLTIAGAVFGAFLGKVLHGFTIGTVEVDSCMFGRNINPVSYVYAVLFTICFSVIVNGVMYFKLKKIDMVESLKSIE